MLVKHGLKKTCINKDHISDEDVYLMYVLYHYRHVSTARLAKRFGITTAQVRDLMARRSSSGCCG